jgi:hypothetical protein
MSVAVIENASSKVKEMEADVELQSGYVPNEALALVMAAQISEEFRKFLLVIALPRQ